MENKDKTSEKRHLELLQLPVIGENVDRFIIVPESLSAHCCFCYSIVDTYEGKENYGDYWKRIMCECFEKEEAEMICQALNKHFR